MHPSRQYLTELNPVGNDVLMLESDANYTLVHFTDGKEILVSYNLGLLEQSCIGEIPLIRPNRKFSVNLKYLIHFDFDTVFIKGKSIRISRRRKESIHSQIQNYLNS
jgi:DNA-binding LytR/AlgR family response regulator